MRSKTTLVAVKLTPGELAALDEIVKARFESRSAALLEGLHFLFEKYHVDTLARQQMRTERCVHAPRKRNKAPKAKPTPATYQGSETIYYTK